MDYVVEASTARPAVVDCLVEAGTVLAGGVRQDQVIHGEARARGLPDRGRDRFGR